MKGKTGKALKFIVESALGSLEGVTAGLVEDEIEGARDDARLQV